MATAQAGNGFEVAFSWRGDILRAHATSGARSLDTSVGLWLAIAEEARRVAPDRMLVVGEMRGEPMATDALQAFFARIAGHGLEQVRIAYVEALALDFPPIEEGEILGRESGFNVRVFTNEANALMWLRHGEA
jgi:hypothetical protein